MLPEGDTDLDRVMRVRLGRVCRHRVSHRGRMIVVVGVDVVIAAVAVGGRGMIRVIVAVEGWGLEKEREGRS